MISHDFLKLMAYKAKSTDKREHDILESFHDACKAIITKAELDIHEANIASINEHVKCVLLEQELKTTYNELFKRFPAHASELISRSVLPTRKELEQNVMIK